MATLIVEVEDDKLKMVKDVLKAIGVSVNTKPAKTEKMPNITTIQAINDARNSKVIKLKCVNELFKSI